MVFITFDRNHLDSTRSWTQHNNYEIVFVIPRDKDYNASVISILCKLLSKQTYSEDRIEQSDYTQAICKSNGIRSYFILAVNINEHILLSLVLRCGEANLF